MTRYSVQPGPYDQFLRVSNYVVFDMVAGPLAICHCEADAKKVAAALNMFDGDQAAPVPPPHREEGLCPRGGDHVVGDDWLCKKCGEDTCPV